MRFHRVWLSAVPTLAMLFVALPIARGQYPTAGPTAGAVAPASYQPVMTSGGPMYFLPDGTVLSADAVAYANYLMQPGAQNAGVMQAGYAGPGYRAGYGFDYLPQYGAEASGDPAYASGYCDVCGEYDPNGGPYFDGTCGPRWYDASVEALYLQRENISRTVNFTSDGARGTGDPNIVLSTDNLDFDETPGVRATVRYDIGPASEIEGVYTGVLYWKSSADVTSSTDNLFSVFSDFGGPALFPGFSDTDQATYHSIEYSSGLQSVELNWRRDWMSSMWRAYGSCLLGVRYVQLGENFRHVTQGDDGEMDYRVNTENDLVGFQLGGDMWVCVAPGVSVGGDLKAGVYSNSADQSTRVVADSLLDTLRESASNYDVALVAESNLMVIYQVTPSLTLKAGYQFLFLDGVALATENFNSEPPFLGGPRDVFINDNGSALYHGALAGLEWIW